MEKISLLGDLEGLVDGVNQIKDFLNFEICDSETPIKVIRENGPLIINKQSGNNYIKFQETAHFYRGLNTFLHLEENKYVEENPNFEDLGIMFDVSRNAVLSKIGFKKMINRIASLGYNSAMLYMEDLYEIKSYPYFGYMRGRYTKDELVFMDNYADNLGVELIPCIQTLSHLHGPLRWSFADEIKDTNQTLLVGEPKTYAFIKEALTTISKCFKTRKIHIGMDEALDLGTGNYFNQHGYRDRFDILIEHLKKVCTITESLGLTPMMWSDMFLRIGSKSGYYYDENAVIPNEVVQEIPQNLELVYWDYYNGKRETYNRMIKIHESLQRPTTFAGGIWLFNGIAPNYGRTIATTNSALLECKANGIKKIIATIWLDDGAETSIEACYPGLQLFAEHQFYKDPSINHIKQQFRLLQGEDFDSFMLLDLFDQVKGVSVGNPYSSAVSKLILYQDLLLGLYDKNIEGLNLENHYLELSQRLAKVKPSEDLKFLFDFYTQLAVVLSIKVDLGIKIKSDYDNKDVLQMKNNVLTIDKLVQANKLLQKLHVNLWKKDNKTIGLEVLEIRYGGLINRMEQVKNTLLEWISDTNLSIDELDIDRLPYTDVNTSFPGTNGRNFYQAIVTPNILSVFR